MPRLIDADKLMETIKVHHYPLVVKGLNSTDYGMFTLGIQQAVDEQPTVEAEPVRHGRWIKERNPMMYQLIPYVWVCDQCGTAFYYKTPYCGECGAKMDEEEK